MPVTDYTPALTDVGAVTIARTVNDVGVETGTFGSTTHPTNTQVAPLIQNAVDDVAIEIGTEIPAALFDKAKRLVALRTAMYIELTFFAAEVAQQRSPYAMQKDLYDGELKKLSAAVIAEELGETGADRVDTVMPRFGFPPADNLGSRPL